MAWTNQGNSSSAGSGSPIHGEQGAVLASASTVTLTDFFHQISGTVQVNTLAFSGAYPALFVIQPTGAFAIGSGGNIKNVPATAVVNAMMMFVYDGTNFYHCTGVIGGISITVADNVLTIQDDGDTAKQGQFQLSGITTGNTRTLTWPDFNGTIATLAGTEVLSAKTLTAPVVAILKPASDSTTAVKITKADGATAVITVDTTNSILTTAGGFRITAGSSADGSVSTLQTGAGNGETINTAGLGMARYKTNGSARTGVILQSGTYDGQIVTVVNEDTTAGNSITFAVVATSHVANGVTTIINGLQGRRFIWSANATTAAWYELK